MYGQLFNNVDTMRQWCILSRTEPVTEHRLVYMHNAHASNFAILLLINHNQFRGGYDAMPTTDA